MQRKSLRKRRRIIFVTGTDTGVGKTLFTALLLSSLRSNGIGALAMKPFSTGDRRDAEILQALQKGEASLEQINPYHFRPALAPLVAARKEGHRVSLRAAIASIRKLSRCCQVLLVEGAGGVLVPLGEGFTLADLMRCWECEAVVVAPNRLGGINHALLTASALQEAGIKQVKFALMEQTKRDLASKSNLRVLSELLAPVSVLSLPFMGEGPFRREKIERNSRALKKTLAQFWD